MDYINHSCNDWIGYIKIKIRKNSLNFFLNKKILIYGLGKSGLSTYQFLKNKNDIFLYDDYQSKIKDKNIKKKIIDFRNISKVKFDRILLSPGIDINKCKLSKFLKKNLKIIYSDLDVFYNFYKNDCITITGTNGKSTTCQLLFEILSKQKFDVKLVGNIGIPILSIKNVKKKTLFIIEASSYQLDYSRLFKSKYAAILNLSPDHLERHLTLNKYIDAKFKLLENQSKSNFAFVNKNDLLIQRKLKSKKFKSKIIQVQTKQDFTNLKNFGNHYFLTETNKENLSFVLEIIKKWKINKNLLFKTIENFKGLKYRQQIIYKKNNLMIINDSKSTSFSSSISALKVNSNIFWLLGGLHKKNDKFNLSKKYFKNIRAFIYGRNVKFFNKELKGKIKYQNFLNLNHALKKIFMILKKNKNKPYTILFSPCAASFDSFNNFEERGFYFNKLINRYLYGK